MFAAVSVGLRGVCSGEGGAQGCLVSAASKRLSNTLLGKI